MRELDVCEMAQGPRPGRKRRNLRWPAGRARQAQCVGATRPEAVAAGAAPAGVAVGATWRDEVAEHAARYRQGAGAGTGGASVALLDAPPGAVEPAAGRLPTGRPPADRVPTGRPATGRAVTGRAVTERAATARVATGRAVTERTATDRATPGRMPTGPAGTGRAGVRRTSRLRPIGAGPAVVAPRTVRPAGRRCVAPARRRSTRMRVRPMGERLLVGVVAVVCSGAVVVLLGLLGDAAAGWNAGPAAPIGSVVTSTPAR